jgi:hypothetical protein
MAPNARLRQIMLVINMLGRIVHQRLRTQSYLVWRSTNIAKADSHPLVLEQILWQPVMMPSGDVYPCIDYWMPH